MWCGDYAARVCISHETFYFSWIREGSTTSLMPSGRPGTPLVFIDMRAGCFFITELGWELQFSTRFSVMSLAGKGRERLLIASRGPSATPRTWVWRGHRLLFFLFRAASAVHGSSQARGRIGATAASLRQSHSNMGSKPICNLHHSSQQCWILNPRARPGIEPESSWALVGLVTAKSQWELLGYLLTRPSLTPP